MAPRAISRAPVWGSKAPAPGDVLGRYVLLEILGSGGMGTVYAARDPGLERKVALKLLREPKEQPRLLREAKALARLAHPHVVAVYDVGTFEGRTFLAMELVEGWNLREWQKIAPRKWREITTVLLEAGRGLAAAHSAGLVHRDFKPDNVLIGRDGRARVADFGLADEVKTTSPAPTDDVMPGGGLLDPKLTQDGTVMGTPSYMAPEQFEGVPANARTDQFSFAVAAWEALFGERPFRASTLAGLIIKLGTGQITLVEDRRGVPRWLERVLRRALSADPAKRYPSMEALLADASAELRAHEAQLGFGGGRYEAIDPAIEGASRRLVDRLTGQVVTLQPVHLFAEDERQLRRAISRELVSLGSLQHPHLVEVLDAGLDDQDRPFFVLDLREPSEDLLEGAKKLSPALKRTLAVQLLGALTYLHRRELVHGDLTPAHVRLAGGRARLIPLGAARLPSAEVRWRAPELQRGHTADARSDLYSFGAILRRLLATDSTKGLPALLDRLTAENPADRPGSAEDAAELLRQVFGMPGALDTPETRESFLQTAQFVGRRDELARLSGALRSAVEGHGSAWLIGGESGVGKSRLVDELRVLAIAEGAIVLRGQEESDAGAPYALWRSVLRPLLSITEISDFEASVLLPVLPEAPRLIGRSITPTAELEGPAMALRLVDVVLRLLRRQTRPLLLLLEDLHCSPSASLKLLQALLQDVAGLPLLIVATFRSDERPELPGELQQATRIELGRLEAPAIADLALSMIGPAARREDLLAFLRQETEGNALFLVEVVRALAEESGGLEHLRSRAMPNRVLAQRMRDVLQRRLSRVPEDALPALQLAAVTGRRIDLQLLEHAIPNLDLTAWTRACIDAAVLVRTDAELRFAHDKLREELILELDQEAREQLHRCVLEAIEAVHGTAPEWIAALAYHAHTANDRAREMKYAAMAGEQALHQFADREAVVFLERALELRGDDAGTVEKARLHAQTGTAYFHLMDFSRASTHLAAAGRAVGHALPARGAKRFAAIAWQLAVQVAHRFTPRLFRARSDARRAELIEASNAAAQLANLYIFSNDGLGVLGSSLLATNAAENAGEVNPLSLGMLGLAAGAVGLEGAAEKYFAQMHRAEGSVEQRRGLTAGIIAEASYYIGAAKLDRAEQLINLNLDLCFRHGDRVNQSYTDYLAGVLAYYRGDLEEALARLGTARTRLEGTFSRHAATGFASFEAFVLSTRNKQDEALALLSATSDSFTVQEQLSQAIWFGVLAHVQARRGDVEQAERAAARALSLVPSGRFAPPTAAGLVSGVVESSLASFAAGRTGPRTLKRAERYAASWAKVYPVGAPQALLHRGQIALALGNPRAASDAFAGCVDLASTLGLGAQTYVALGADSLARVNKPT